MKNIRVVRHRIGHSMSLWLEKDSLQGQNPPLFLGIVSKNVCQRQSSTRANIESYEEMTKGIVTHTVIALSEQERSWPQKTHYAEIARWQRLKKL